MKSIHMRRGCRATMIALATMTVLGCGGGATAVQPDASAHSDATAQSAPFELQGTWVYLGPWDGEHTLKINCVSIVYSAVAGDWSSTWTIKDYDNGLHHFQMVFESGTGTYYPTGQKLSGTYDLNGAILTIQLSNGLGSYLPVQSPGSCTEGASTLIPDCRLYMKQN